MKTTFLTHKETESIDPKTLILNDIKLNILGKSKNFNELYKSINERGVLTPLLVNKSNIIISGNMRLYIALELNLESVPVNYVDVEETDIVTILHTDVSREKTLSEKLNIYFILIDKYKPSQGIRTDLCKEKKEQMDEFNKLNPFSEHNEKMIKNILKDNTQDEIFFVLNQLEKSKKNLKMPDVKRGLESLKSVSQPERNVIPLEGSFFNDNFELYLNFNSLFEINNLKEEVMSLNVNGGSVFITNVPEDSNFNLWGKMIKVGMTLYTIKETSNSFFTYQFIFIKSNVPPNKKINVNAIQIEKYQDLKRIG
jgi:hypothetical protein